MLVNPYSENLPIIAGTRILVTDLGLTGTQVVDPRDPRRIWTVTNVYGPVEGRRLGGIRVKLTDQKGFTTFCNQRDFEVLIGLGQSGEWCKWMASDYPAPTDEEWIGFCMDRIDLEDDLFERELTLRCDHPHGLPEGIDMLRRVHVAHRQDAEDMWVLLWDRAPETGVGPDPRLETIYSRWSPIARDWIEWRRA